MASVGIELCPFPRTKFGNNLKHGINATLIELIRYAYSATIAHTTSELCYCSSHDMNAMLLEHTRRNYMLMGLA